MAKKTDQKSQKMNNLKENLNKLFKQQARIKESAVKKMLEDVHIDSTDPQNDDQLPQSPPDQNPQSFEPESQFNDNNEVEFGAKKAGLNLNGAENNDEPDDQTPKPNDTKEAKGKPKASEFSEPLDDSLLGKRKPEDFQKDSVDPSKRVKPSDQSATDAIFEYSQTIQNESPDRQLTDPFDQPVEHGAHIQAEKLKLCEELKSILEQKKISDLKGDYRTGKRLNMKRVISYIASNYRKDKIWLRRTDPSETHYRILVGVDDSSSMR